MQNQAGNVVHLQTIRAATRADAISLLESGFRHVDLPPMSEDDLNDVRQWLDEFARGVR